MQRLLHGITLLALVTAPIYAQEDHDTGRLRRPTTEKAEQETTAEPLTGLDNVDPGARIAAVRRLGQIGDEHALEGLVRALQDESASVAAAAARALGAIGSPRALQPLINALEHGRGLVRAAAAEAMGQIGDTKAVQPLVRALRDSSDIVRVHVAMALRALGWRPTTDEEQVSYCIAAQNWEELAKIGPCAVEALVLALQDGVIGKSAAETLDAMNWRPANAKERVAYLIAQGNEEELARMGDGAVEPLLRVLAEGHDGARTFAAYMLGRIGSDNVVPSLVDALRAESRSVRRAAADALGNLAWQCQTADETVVFLIAKRDWQGLVQVGPPAVQALIELLHQDDPVREVETKGAALALGDIGDKQAVQPLIEALERKAYHCRVAAAVALGEIGDERAIRPLVNALRNDSDDLRDAASIALGEIGSLAFDLLIQALQDNDPRVRESAARALGTMRDRRAVAGLIQALTDSHSDVRRVSAWALGAISDRSAASALATRLRNADEAVRQSAASALQIVDKRSYDRWMARQKAKKYAVPSAVLLLGTLVLIILYTYKRKGVS